MPNSVVGTAHADGLAPFGVGILVDKVMIRVESCVVHAKNYARISCCVMFCCSLHLLSYKKRNSHYKDKSVSKSSYLYNGNPHTWKVYYMENMAGWCWSFLHISRQQSRYAPSQWETLLQCNNVSHWLGAYLNWSLHIFQGCFAGTMTIYQR